MTPEKLLVRSAFARAAPRYDVVADFQREAGEQLLLECDELPPPARVLDAGCGTGHGLRLIGKRWPAEQSIALDFAEPMLRGLPKAVRRNALCGDMERLPLSSGSVDLVWSSLAMQWCDTSRVAQEFARVLRTGGHLAVATLGPGTFAELRGAFARVDAFRHTNDFMEMDELREILLTAGFTILRLRRAEILRHYPDLRSLLASVRELGASHVAPANRRPGLMGKAAWQQFEYNYEQMRTGRGLPLSYDTYFIVARRVSTL